MNNIVVKSVKFAAPNGSEFTVVRGTSKNQTFPSIYCSIAGGHLEKHLGYFCEDINDAVNVIIKWGGWKSEGLSKHDYSMLLEELRGLLVGFYSTVAT